MNLNKTLKFLGKEPIETLDIFELDFESVLELLKYQSIDEIVRRGS